MEVVSYNKEMKEKVIGLLQNINNLEIDENIIKNCSLLLDEYKDIIGIISYEKFDKVGLIRYFIFKRNIGLDSLLLLYNCLENNIKKDGIKNVIGIVNSEEVREVFEYIGFKKFDSFYLFFDETNFLKTNYRDSLVYEKSI